MNNQYLIINLIAVSPDDFQIPPIMKSLLPYLILVISLVVSSCKKDKQKPDPEDPRLPAYTEKGLNTSGILINDTVWSGTTSGLLNRTAPFEIHSYPDADSVLFLFNGSYPDALEQYSPTRQLFVVVRNVQIRTDEDLKKLNGQQFILDGQNQYGGFSVAGYIQTGRATGFLQFGKVDRLPNFQYGDGSPGYPISYAYIVSGRFEFSLTTTRQFKLSKGRFDATVSRTPSRFTVN